MMHIHGNLGKGSKLSMGSMCFKGTSTKEKEKVSVNSDSKTAQDMKANGLGVGKAGDDLGSLMALFIQVCGKTTKNMVRAKSH